DTSEFSPGVVVTGLSPESPPVTSADLSIVAVVLTQDPQVGHELVYQFTVTNHGPDMAHTAFFSHTLPTGIQDIVADSSAGAAVINGNQVTANLGNLANGDSATITITATPNAAGMLGGSGGVAGFEIDPNSADNTASVQTTVAPGTLDTDLAV